jgi:hypothetical protein
MQTYAGQRVVENGLPFGIKFTHSDGQHITMR